MNTWIQIFFLKMIKIINFPGYLSDISTKKEALASSASFLAELSVRSPRKLIIFIIQKNIFWIQVSKNYFI